MAGRFFEAEFGCGHLAMILAAMVVPMLFNWRVGFGLNIVFVAVAAGWLMMCKRRIGGMTGDTLGALGEITEALLLFTACVA